MFFGVNKFFYTCFYISNVWSTQTHVSQRLIPNFEYLIVLDFKNTENMRIGNGSFLKHKTSGHVGPSVSYRLMNKILNAIEYVYFPVNILTKFEVPWKFTCQNIAFWPVIYSNHCLLKRSRSRYISHNLILCNTGDLQGPYVGHIFWETANMP